MKYAHILFDWGNTLMIDDARHGGPMCDWPHVAALNGAERVLAELSHHIPCHVATNADDSDGAQVRRALERVGLGRYIDGIFCSSEIGYAKPDPAFFAHILNVLNCPASKVLMVGDHLEKDIRGAQAAGIHAVWLRHNPIETADDVPSIADLEDLCYLVLGGKG